MYVCVCLAVTEAEVRAAIASGATTREIVTRACSAGGDCGACHGMIDEMIEAHVEATLEGQLDSCPTLAACPLPSPSGERLVPAENLTRTRAA